MANRPGRDRASSNSRQETITLKFLMSLFVASLTLAGCGNSADQYQAIVDEYKKVCCIAMDPNASMTVKTEALSRQMELNAVYQQALASLPTKEQQALLMAWSKAVAEVADGNCP